jgi:hypothetical protein
MGSRSTRSEGATRQRAPLRHLSRRTCATSRIIAPWRCFFTGPDCSICAPDGPALPCDILLDGERIASVTPSGLDFSAPSRVDMVDLDGRLVIPGLWDEHVHAEQWALASRRLKVSQTASSRGDSGRRGRSAGRHSRRCERGDHPGFRACGPRAGRPTRVPPIWTPSPRGGRWRSSRPICTPPGAIPPPWRGSEWQARPGFPHRGGLLRRPDQAGPGASSGPQRLAGRVLPAGGVPRGGRNPRYGVLQQLSTCGWPGSGPGAARCGCRWRSTRTGSRRRSGAVWPPGSARSRGPWWRWGR